jgi:hypothetical protein
MIITQDNVPNLLIERQVGVVHKEDDSEIQFIDEAIEESCEKTSTAQD